MHLWGLLSWLYCQNEDDRDISCAPCALLCIRLGTYGRDSRAPPDPGRASRELPLLLWRPTTLGGGRPESRGPLPQCQAPSTAFLWKTLHITSPKDLRERGEGGSARPCRITPLGPMEASPKSSPEAAQVRVSQVLRGPLLGQQSHPAGWWPRPSFSGGEWVMLRAACHPAPFCTQRERSLTGGHSGGWKATQIARAFRRCQAAQKHEKVTRQLCVGPCDPAVPPSKLTGPWVGSRPEAPTPRTGL